MVRQIRVNELASKLAAGEPVYLLDVRLPDEHATAALPGSVLIPLAELSSRAGEVQPLLVRLLAPPPQHHRASPPAVKTVCTPTSGQVPGAPMTVVL